MRYVDIFRDHPVDPDAPHIVPASFLEALRDARDYSPTFGLPTCSGARCECGAQEDELDITDSEVPHFICEECRDD